MNYNIGIIYKTELDLKCFILFVIQVNRYFGTILTYQNLKTLIYDFSKSLNDIFINFDKYVHILYKFDIQ